MRIRIGFERLLAHDRWANGRALQSLEAMADPPGKGCELLAHLLGAEVCWIDRMTLGREGPDLERWDHLDLAGIRRAWEEEVPARWESFLADDSASAPGRAFTFVDDLGNTSRPVRVEDAITQLMLHSAYHRGQVASHVRAAGGTPAVVDFLPAVRAGAVPEGGAP
jgi:uncharacterized damage-inducible protein DinB